MHVGTRIKTARQTLGLSQSDLAQRAQVSQPTVANWENGSHAPRHAALTKIADALNATPASLLGAPPAPSGSVLAQHHVPILNPPASPGDIDSGAVIGYMMTDCEAARPFAFFAPQNYPQLNVAKGDTLIFDRAAGDAREGAVYLQFGPSGMMLGATDIKKDAPTGARLIMSLSRF